MACIERPGPSQQLQVGRPSHRGSNMPLEVWESIIDACSGDTVTLKACATVCRAFVRPSRTHLYRHIVVTTSPVADSVIEALERNPDSRGAVIELHLDGASPLGALAGWVCRVLRRLLPMLHRLQTLRLWSMSLTSPSVPHLLSAVRRTVSRLEIAYCQVFGFAELADILSALPGITNLVISYITVRHGQMTASPEIEATGMALTSLCVKEQPYSGSWMAALAHWLNETSTPSSLRKMDLRPTSFHAGGAKTMVLLPKPGNLDILTLARGLSGVGDLSDVPSLRKLRVIVDIGDIMRCAALLSSIVPGALTDLLLVFVSGFLDIAPRDLETFEDIARLDPILAHPRFSSLERFSVQCQTEFRQDRFESLECREHVQRVWLPNVDHTKWADDLAEAFHV